MRGSLFLFRPLVTDKLSPKSICKVDLNLEKACSSRRRAEVCRSHSEHSRRGKAGAGESYGRKFKQRASKDIGPDIAAAYNMAVAEAEALGIPKYALPRLSNEPTLEEAREVQEKIESIIASFTSANI